MAESGVRSSWLMLAMKVLLARLASSAASLASASSCSAFLRSVMSMHTASIVGRPRWAAIWLIVLATHTHVRVRPHEPMLQGHRLARRFHVSNGSSGRLGFLGVGEFDQAGVAELVSVAADQLAEVIVDRQEAAFEIALGKAGAILLEQARQMGLAVPQRGLGRRPLDRIPDAGRDALDQSKILGGPAPHLPLVHEQQGLQPRLADQRNRHEGPCLDCGPRTRIVDRHPPARQG